MSERYGAVVIGAGIGGRTCARRLSDGGMHVALVERELIGGEMAYWAAIPSKTLLGPINLLWRMEMVAGVKSPTIAWPRETTYDDELVQQLDDAAQGQQLRSEGITVLHGAARIIRPGVVEVGDHLLETEHIVIATGSAPHIPEIEGLAEAGYWTNREATTFKSLPQSIVVLGGGGAHAIELGQMFRLYGSEVTLVISADRLAPHEDPGVGELLAEHLHHSGMRVLLDRSARRVERDEEEEGLRVVTLDDGSCVRGQELLIAMGRAPVTTGLGLERAGVRAGAQGIQVDAYCRAAEGVWAIGDVTGMGMFVHTAQYQARIVADAILGHGHPAHYHSVPRVAFTDPQFAATGFTLAQAREQGLAVHSLTVDLAHPLVHAQSYGEGVGGKMTLHADRHRGTLIGAWAVAPDAGDWIQLAVLAIRAAVPIDVLRDTLEQFPSFSETYLSALDQFAREMRLL